MPEGDTLRRIADVVGPMLVGRRVRGWLTSRRVPLEDVVVTRVDAVGKHLLVAFDDGRVLRTHLGMHGAWHRYDPGERWHRSPRLAAAVLETDDDVLVCFGAKECDVFAARDAALHPALRRLGPDLLDDPPLDPIVDVARSRDDGVAEVLLDQSVACGLGNVYKSEVLFLERVHPLTPASSLSVEKLRAIYARSVELLKANVGGWSRTTTVDRRVRELAPGQSRVWVYGRAGRPCLVCGTPIETARTGPHARVTTWCPSCQPRAMESAAPR